MCSEAVDNPGRGRAPLQAKQLLVSQTSEAYWHILAPCSSISTALPFNACHEFPVSQPMNQIRPPSLELAATKDGQGPAGHSPGANRFPQQLTSAIFRKENAFAPRKPKYKQLYFVATSFFQNAHKERTVSIIVGPLEDMSPALTLLYKHSSF